MIFHYDHGMKSKNNSSQQFTFKCRKCKRHHVYRRKGDMNVQERRGETLMNDLTMKRINEKYPVLVKCFQIAIYAIDARNRYFSVQSEDRKVL